LNEVPGLGRVPQTRWDNLPKLKVEELIQKHDFDPSLQVVYGKGMNSHSSLMVYSGQVNSFGQRLGIGRFQTPMEVIEGYF